MKKIILTTLMLILSYSMPIASSESKTQNSRTYSERCEEQYRKFEKIIAKKIMETPENKTIIRGALIGGCTGLVSGLVFGMLWCFSASFSIQNIPLNILKIIGCPQIGACAGACIGGLVAQHVETALENIK